MILESGVIPPNTNFEKANPKIPLDKWRLKLPLEPMPWPSAGTRQVSINSFGFSGTNGHVVLQDAYHYLESRKLDGRHRTLAQPGLNGHGDSGTNGVHVNGAVANGDADGAHVNGAVANGDANGAHINGAVPNGDAPEHASNGTNGTTTNTNGHSVSPSPPLLFPFSAFDEAGVQRNMHSIAAYYTNLVPPSASDEQTLLQDLAYTLAAKRTSFPWRSYTLASSLAELVDRLTQGTAVPRPERTRSTPNIGFVFTGQGAQWFAMGRELLAYPVFERSLSAASGYMRGLGSEWELYGMACPFWFGLLGVLDKERY
jgi:acyl transferase domain-containing protein